MSTYASAAKASAGKSRSEYSHVAVGGALVFGAVVGMAGVHLSSSPLITGARTDLGQTSTRTVSKNVDFATDTFDFNHCLQGDYTPPDPAYASWSSDGSSGRKLDNMKQEALLDPIGEFVNEDGEYVKYYNKDYAFQEADGDGAPLADTRASIETMKTEVLTTCVNPLPGIEADGLLAETSKACSSEISAAAAKVYEDYKACKKVADGIDAKLDDYSTWSGIEYQLQSDRDALLKLYNDRKDAGKKYDKDFEKWMAAHNDALASCAYATNYQTLSANVDSQFIQLLKSEKDTISAHCANIPSMDQFQVKNIGVTSRRALLQSDSKTCESILEAMQGVSDSEKFEHDGRANCLEFYCESAATTKDPAARGVAVASLATYDDLDAQFAAALAAFNANHDQYTQFKAAIDKNLKLVSQASDEVTGLQNVTDTDKGKLLHYLACPSSSICCQAPEDVPKICAEDAAGEVAKFAAPTEFTLRSPPPPPSPPPPSPKAGGVECASGKFYFRSERQFDKYCGVGISTGLLRCDRNIKDKTIFDLTQKGNKGGSWIAMVPYGSKTKYCADSSKNDRVVECDRSEKGDWENFKFFPHQARGENVVAIKGGNGSGDKYCADEGNSLKCDRGSVGPWERYTLFCEA